MKGFMISRDMSENTSIWCAVYGIDASFLGRLMFGGGGIGVPESAPGAVVAGVAAAGVVAAAAGAVGVGAAVVGAGAVGAGAVGAGAAVVAVAGA
jgi:hypothetical protein